MVLKSFVAKLFAQKVFNDTQKWAQNPIDTQQKVFRELIANAQSTVFGKDHHFEHSI